MSKRQAHLSADLLHQTGFACAARLYYDDRPAIVDFGIVGALIMGEGCHKIVRCFAYVGASKIRVEPLQLILSAMTDISTLLQLTRWCTNGRSSPFSW